VTVYRYGDVAQNILEYQQEHGIQIIVLGAFSHSKISVLLGKYCNHDFPKRDCTITCG
jgi:nucleotide-binding universal stress UspA family protein